MSNESSHLELQGRGEREGMQSATLAGDARMEAEKTLVSPFLSWDDLRKLTTLFISDTSVRIMLQGVSQLESYELRPLECPNFMNYFKDTFYQELQLRSQYGKSNISSIGWIKGGKKVEGRSWHRISSGNAYLVQGLRGGQDATFYAERGLGKSDCCLHYYALPYLELGNYVVSGVRIENNNEYPNYRYCATNADLLLESCNIVIEKLTDGLPMPNIMLIRDDIAGSGISRKRAGSQELFNLECLGMVTRHYGIATIWIFQYMLSIPTSIREATTRWVQKKTKKTLISTIKWPKGTETTYITGLKGLDDRKMEGMPYLDYDSKRPQITMDNLPMSEVMMYVNYKERVKEMTKLERFTAIRDYLDNMLKMADADKAVSQVDILRAITWLYVEGKKVKGMKTIPITIGGLQALSGLKKGTIRLAVEKAVKDWSEHPERWKPLPTNIDEQRKVITDAINEAGEDPTGQEQNDGDQAEDLDS